MAGLSIPTSARMRVRGRDRGRCVACQGPGSDIHHRRTRRVADEHVHCTCNLIILCGPGNVAGDHGWAHKNPFEARTQGLIIARHDSRPPYEVPILLAGRGWFLLDCEGGMTQTGEPK